MVIKKPGLRLHLGLRPHTCKPLLEGLSSSEKYLCVLAEPI